MQLVIIAGGKGTRLKARIGDLPKPLVEVCGRPLLEHQLLLAIHSGIRDIVLLTGYGAEHIRSYCGDGSRWGVGIRCVEEPEPLGTAGAVLNALPLLAERFVVMYGDTFVDVDLTRMWHFHAEKKADATLFLHPNDHPRDSDLVEVDASNRILAFHPYPHPADAFLPNLVNGALYVLERKPLEKAVHDPKVLDFGRHIFPEMLRSGCFLCGYRSPEYIKDAGTPERLDRVIADVLSGRVVQRSLRQPAPVIFLDRDGTINREMDRVRSADQFFLIEGVADAVKSFNRSEYRTVVITNQPVVARGDCDEIGLQHIHNKMETLLGWEGAFIDGIYYCPHHPDHGFPGERVELKIDCDCRKPGIGMIERAAKELNLDLNRAWIIGDSTVDVETARRAGVKSVLLRTGHGGRDAKYPCRPDFEFFSLEEAADFILECWPQLLEKSSGLLAEVPPGQVVLIGGQARSGKSTWASGFKYALRERGINAIIIPLDVFLKSEPERPSGGDVRDRYNLAAAEAFIHDLRSHGGSRRMPFYDRYTRSIRPDGAEVIFREGDMIIVEGVVALMSQALLEIAALRTFIACPGQILRETFLREYLHRGYSMEDAEILFNSRLSDEAPIVESSRSASDILIERYCL